MSNTLNITAKERVSKGKSNSRNLRSSNLIPAIIYGGAIEAQKIQLLENIVSHSFIQKLSSTYACDDKPFSTFILLSSQIIINIYFLLSKYY